MYVQYEVKKQGEQIAVSSDCAETPSITWPAASMDPRRAQHPGARRLAQYRWSRASVPVCAGSRASLREGGWLCMSKMQLVGAYILRFRLQCRGSEAKSLWPHISHRREPAYEEQTTTVKPMPIWNLPSPPPNPLLSSLAGRRLRLRRGSIKSDI